MIEKGNILEKAILLYDQTKIERHITFSTKNHIISWYNEKSFTTSKLTPQNIILKYIKISNRAREEKLFKTFSIKYTIFRNLKV